MGLGEADIVVALTDGGNGLEECLVNALGGLSRQTVCILDFWHAAEHLQEFGKALLPHDEPRRKRQVEQWCHRLKHAGGSALLEDLESLDLSRASAAVREEHRQLLGYFRSNQHRMNYPVYVARGWQIGSGAIESACKTVVGQRLKLSGMRWRERGTNALCHLRALYKSKPNLWTSYWRTTVAS